jgi:hypothetical protein
MARVHAAQHVQRHAQRRDFLVFHHHRVRVEQDDGVEQHQGRNENGPVDNPPSGHRAAG